MFTTPACSRSFLAERVFLPVLLAAVLFGATGCTTVVRIQELKSAKVPGRVLLRTKDPHMRDFIAVTRSFKPVFRGEYDLQLRYKFKFDYNKSANIPLTVSLNIFVLCVGYFVPVNSLEVRSQAEVSVESPGGREVICFKVGENAYSKKCGWISSRPESPHFRNLRDIAILNSFIDIANILVERRGEILVRARDIELEEIDAAKPESLEELDSLRRRLTRHITNHGASKEADRLMKRLTELEKRLEGQSP